MRRVRRDTLIAICATVSVTAVSIAAVFVAGAMLLQARNVGAGGTGSSARTPLAAPVADTASPTARRVAEAAMAQVGRTVRYNADYVPIGYPGGDVPIDRGACTDVVVRAFRAVGVDLQVAVHNDMTRHFSAYPHKWGLTKPNANIDHRRVPNLQVFFRRAGKSLPVTMNGADYQPGDVVTWSVSGKPHTGVVSTALSRDGTRFCVAHNIGAGVKIADVLFRFPITGHYRYF